MATEKSVLNRSDYDMLNPAPMNWPVLFEPRRYEGKGEPKFSCQFLLTPDHPDFAGLKAKAAAVARAEWPDADFKTITFPFENGDTKAAALVADGKKGDRYVGKVIFKTTSPRPPVLSATINGKFVELEGSARDANAALFFAGAEALASVSFVAWDIKPNRFVVAYLNKVYTTQKGEHFTGGGRSSAETFKGYLGHASSENPTLGDDIAF